MDRQGIVLHISSARRDLGRCRSGRGLFLRYLAPLLQDWRPWQIALLACALAFLVSRALAWASRIRVAVRDRGALQTVFDGLKSLPIVHGIVRDQQEKLVVRPRG